MPGRLHIPTPPPPPPGIGSPALWGAFVGAVLVLLAADLFIIRRRKTAAMRDALYESLCWITLSVGFGLYLMERHGFEPGLEFFAGYVLEQSLSVDNLFVFVLLFQAMAVPPEHQHRVLFWGILGALVLRGALILAGVALVRRYSWLLSIFGLLLTFTAIKLALLKDSEDEKAPADNLVVRAVRRMFPVTPTIDGPAFFVRVGGRRMATPLLIALVAAETADLVFALDSIPAVFGVTADSFIVFSSNICAILGLRALYFVIRGALTRVRYLKPGLAAVLLFVGLKMVVSPWLHMATGVSLAIIGGILGAAFLISWMHGEPRPGPAKD